MRKLSQLRHLLLSGFVICAPASANIIYSGSFSTANNTVTYSVETNGAFGILTSSDIVSVSFSDAGTLAFSIVTASAAEIEVIGTDLSATAETLAFDFDDQNVGRFIFGGLSFSPYVAFETSAQNLNVIPSREIVNIGGPNNEEIFSPAIAGDVIAQTPEPGTLIAMLAGSMMLSLPALKRFRARVRRPTYSAVRADSGLKFKS
jgi:hypothetical protein